MHILVINPGSSSIKLGLFAVAGNDVIKEFSTSTDTSPQEAGTIAQQLIEQYPTITELVIGVRIVHGGQKFTTATEITNSVMDELEELHDLAPLHNPLSFEAIRSIQRTFTQVKIIGVFDTSFHTTMPIIASQYALPYEITTTHHIKRYGFHGLAHASMLRQYSEYTHTDSNSTTITTIQLGSGCSMCAIRQGISVDTSMGFSPLEGLISRTRTGSIDPQTLLYLQKKTGKSLEELLYIYNHESGLKGLSGTDGHIQSLLQLNSERSSTARALFVYRIQQYIGAYDAVLQQKADIVFGGGISEHAPTILEAVCANPFFEIMLNKEVLQQQHTTTVQLTTESSKRHVYLVFVDEEYEIAKEVYKKL